MAEDGLATWEITVGNPAVYGIAWVACASQEMPAIRKATMVPWVTGSAARSGPPAGAAR